MTPAFLLVDTLLLQNKLDLSLVLRVHCAFLTGIQQPTQLGMPVLFSSNSSNSSSSLQRQEMRRCGGAEVREVRRCGGAGGAGGAEVRTRCGGAAAVRRCSGGAAVRRRGGAAARQKALVWWRCGGAVVRP